MTMSKAAQALLWYLRNEKQLEDGQLDAVTSERKTIAVNACAGSGKTLTLAWRFVWRAIAADDPVDRMLTITFTEKAAQEMNQRIRAYFDEVAEMLPECRDRAREALQRLDQAYISTIHSFAMRTLRECGLSVDMDPGSRVVSAAQEDAFWSDMERRIDRLQWGREISGLSEGWAVRAGSLFNDPLVAEMVDHFGPGRLARMTADSISLHASRNRTPEDLWRWAGNIEERDEDAARDVAGRFKAEWKNAWKLWLEEVVPEGSRGFDIRNETTKFGKRLCEFLDRWSQEEPQDGDLPSFIKDLLAGEGLLGSLHRGKLLNAVEEALKGSTGESLKIFRDSRKEWLACASWLGSGFHPVETEIRGNLLKLTAVIWTIWLDAKNARGLLSFDDMIRRASEAISSNRPYASRFVQIMVDEFQDTNGLQADLVRSLHGSGDSGLFIVGDLQQSIYRFRHAQPELFWKWLSRPEEEVERITLDVTFRSRQCVMNNINALFSGLWSDGVASGTPQPYTPLTPPEKRDWWPERQNGSLEPFHVIVSANDTENDDGEKLKVQDVRENLFRLVAYRINKAVENGRTVWAENGNGGYGLRPVTYGDVTVLVPSRSQYESIEKVFLEEWNIPVVFESNRDFYSRSEVRDIGSLLSMLAGSPDETTLASWLLSPFSGVSPDEAMNILADRRDDSGKQKSIADTLGDRRPDIVTRMEELRKKALTEGPASALGRLLQDVSAVAAHPSWRRRRVAANIRRAIDLAREYENTAGGNLAGCAAWIRNTIRNGSPSAEAGALDDESDMVRVMTIHAAKGLEFPVTILAGLEHRPKTRPPSASLAPSPVFGAIFTSFPQGYQDEKPLAPKIHDAMELFDALEEQERLLYVACTRAKDSLVLCAAGGKTEEETGVSFPRNSCMSRLSEVLALPAASPPPEPPSRGGKHQPDPCAPPDAFLPRTPRRGLTRISATSWALMRYCPYAFRMRHRQGMEIAWESPSRDGPGGPDLGSLAHWILKHWDLDPANLAEWLPGGMNSEKTASVLPVHLRPVWRDENRTAMLREWLKLFADSPTAEAMRLSGHLEREAPFRIAVADQLFLVGSIDALWKEGDIIRMTDYKITLENDAPEGLYEDQLTAYALAVRERFGDIPIRASLCMLREGAEHPVEIPNDMERVRTEIAQAAEKAVTGPFEPSPERCPSCPWQRSCAAAVLA